MSNNVFQFLINGFKKLEAYIGAGKSNKEIFLFTIILSFSLFCRLFSFSIISIIVVSMFLLYMLFNFYLFANKQAKIENRNKNIAEYSWGFIKEETESLNVNSFLHYLKDKDLDFYRKYFYLNLDMIIVSCFILGDLVVAFKNLSFNDSGIYFALSIFCKFVFIAYFFMKNIYDKTKLDNLNEEDKNKRILDIFYSQINGIFSVAFVLFILFFVLSKYLVEIFFGMDFSPYQSSLPFVLVANLMLMIALCIYYVSYKINVVQTKRIFKFFVGILSIFFVFWPIGYIDTIPFFVIGSSSILSIFLYNFVIKSPSYISSTYNLTF